MAISRKSKVKAFGSEIYKGPVGSILSNSYRSILFGLGMDAERYDALMTRYIRRALSDSSRKDRVDVREGLSEELLKESMTWKTYLKGFKFLGVTDVTITISILRKNGRRTTHSLTFSMADLNVDIDEDIEVDGGTLSTPGMVLGKLYADIGKALEIDEKTFQTLMTEYIRTSQVGSSKKAESAARASLTKELSRKTITWKTFVKGLVFYETVEFRLNVTLTHAFGEKTSHAIKPVAVGDISSE